jgi:uncharacterized protein (DUF885 family)
VPYVVTQLTGAYQSTPDFLASQHPIESAADAEAYLSRLEAFAGELRHETLRVRDDLARGLVPPDFIGDKTLTQLRLLRGQSGAASGLVRSIVKRTAEKGIPGEWGARAARIVDGPLASALDEQILAVGALRGRAAQETGARDRGRWRAACNSWQGSALALSKRRCGPRTAARRPQPTGRRHSTPAARDLLGVAAQAGGSPARTSSHRARRAAVESEIDRYCVWPGQARGCKVGHLELLRLRDKARGQLGTRFDLRGFHEVVLEGGAMPLEVLERVVEAWAAGQVRSG